MLVPLYAANLSHHTHVIQPPNIHTSHTYALNNHQHKQPTQTTDLQSLADGELSIVLGGAGIRGDAADEVAAALQAVPQVGVSVAFEVDGEDEVCERDPVHCRVRVLLSRRAHAARGFSLKGSAVRAFTPCNPEPQDEAWYAFLVDPAGNHVLAFTKANLIEAERAALEHPGAIAATLRNEDVLGRDGGGGGGAGGRPVAFVGLDGAKAPGAGGAAAAAAAAGKGSGGGGSEAAAAAADGGSSKGGSGKGKQPAPGQVLDLVFMAPPAGRYDLQLLLMSSTWVGADLSVALRLRVNPLTRAAAEGRDAKSLEKRRFGGDSDAGSDDDDEDGERRERRGGGGSEDGSGSDSGSESGGSDEPRTDEYDSEETGEEVSSDDDDAGDAAVRGAASRGATAGGSGGAAPEEGKKDV